MPEEPEKRKARRLSYELIAVSAVVPVRYVKSLLMLRCFLTQLSISLLATKDNFDVVKIIFDKISSGRHLRIDPDVNLKLFFFAFIGTG